MLRLSAISTPSTNKSMIHELYPRCIKVTHAGKGGLCFILLHVKQGLQISNKGCKCLGGMASSIKNKAKLGSKSLSVIRMIRTLKAISLLSDKRVVRSCFDLKIAAVYQLNCKCRLSKCQEPHVVFGKIGVVYMV